MGYAKYRSTGLFESGFTAPYQVRGDAISRMGNLLRFASDGVGCLGFEDFGVRFAVRVACRSTANTVFCVQRVCVLGFHVLAAAPLRWIPDQVRNDGLKR